MFLRYFAKKNTVTILIALIIFYLLTSFTLAKLFEKAGVEKSKAYIPGVNFIYWAKLIGRKPIYVLWLLVPVVNIFVYAGMAVDMVRSFGRYSFWDSFLAVIATPVIFSSIGKNAQDTYRGPNYTMEKEYKAKMAKAKKSGDKATYQKLLRTSPYEKNGAREWAESIIFAVFAAAFIRMFLIEAYVIPTPSMEGSLLVGDYLFVSKAHYGIRTPMTVLQIPLLHNRIPFLNRESYITHPSLGYHRLKAIEPVGRNKPVVFNYPEGDSVYVVPGRTFSIYDVRRNPQQLGGVPSRYPLTVRPIDKRDHYIKRCIGVGGDTLQIRDRQVYINGKAVENPKKMQFNYKVVSVGAPISPKALAAIGVTKKVAHTDNIYALNSEQVQKIKTLSPDIIVEVQSSNPPNKGLFPHDMKIMGNWTVDNYGPVVIPKKGMTVPLNDFTFPFYQRVIRVYEGNKLEKKGGKFYLNGNEADSYTFKMNYYWMMGDNRHQSEDSRFWGFVPQDHIVGKPLFIWMSVEKEGPDKGIRWNRVFKSASIF
ncbi:MAG TPA: signal peptidase I [Saprospiraceae bacterium]|nr:signal peptidase I [Saprospiraceae bacterium]